MSSSQSLNQKQEDSLEGLGLLVAEERFEYTTTSVDTDESGKYSSPLLKAASRPENDFEAVAHGDGNKNYSIEFVKNAVDPRNRVGKVESEVSLLNQDIPINFDLPLDITLDYQPFEGNFSIQRKLSWEVDEDRVQEEFEGFKEEVEKELLKTERDRYRAASEILEGMQDLEGNMDTEDIPEISDVDCEVVENVVETAEKYDPVETFESLYEVENPGNVEQENEFVSNMLETEYLRENPEEVLREDLSQEGFSNKAELVLRELETEESENIIQKAIDENEEIKSVYTDCWGNMMAVYQDNSRAKLVDSKLINPEEEDSSPLGEIMKGAKEEFTENEYVENMIDEVNSGGYSKEVEDWFTTEYLPENIEYIDDPEVMAKANTLVFGNLKKELKKGDEDPELDTSYLENFSENQLPWSYENSETRKNREIEDTEGQKSTILDYKNKIKSKIGSYL